MPIIGSSASGAKSIPNAPTIGTATDVGTSRKGTDLYQEYASVYQLLKQGE